MKKTAKLYNPRALLLLSEEDGNGAALQSAVQDAFAKLEFIQQHPLIHTFHPTLNRAAAMALHILGNESALANGPHKMGAMIFVHQMNEILAKHGADIVVEHPRQIFEWFGFCNSIAMIGICVKGQTEFYPITFPLWAEDQSLEDNVASVTQQGLIGQDGIPGSEITPTPWPPIADSAVAAEAPTIHDPIEDGIDIVATSQPFHSCTRCMVDSDEGWPIFFVAPEYVLYCSSQFTPPGYRVHNDSFNNICPGFVAKFKSTLNLVSPEHGSMSSRVTSRAFVETQDVVFSGEEGHQSRSSNSSMSNLNPHSSGVRRNIANAEGNPVETEQNAIEPPAPLTMEKIRRLNLIMSDRPPLIQRIEKWLSSVNANQEDGHVDQLGHAETRATGF